MKKIRVVLNPVSGTNNNTQAAIKEAMAAHPTLEWDVYETQGDGDARESAKSACADGYDLVIAAGGDGTVREVAEGLIGEDMLMSILPGGTANVLSVELGFPGDLNAILNGLATDDYHMRTIDAAKMDNKTLLLRAGIGYEAQISVGAKREEKKRFGRAAYFLAAWRQLRGLRPTRYYLTLDDEEVVRYGVTCLICNSVNVGIPNVKLINESLMDDGKLDVILVPSMELPYLLRGIFKFMFRRSRNDVDSINHWQAQKVTVRTQATQVMAIDGDYHKRGKRTSAEVIPRALTVAVPN